MEKDQALKDFLGEISNNDEVNPFEENLQDPFGQTVEVPENREVPEEKPLPFNKDPKVSKFIEKEVEKRLKDYVVTETKPNDKPLTTEEDDYYTRLIGNDTPEKIAMIKEAKMRDERMLHMAEERAFNRLSQKEQEDIKAEKEAEAELESAFESIEETYGVDISSNNPLAKKTRQEFGAFVERIAPKDRNGEIVAYPDMTSAWEEFQEKKKNNQQPSRAKDFASRSMSRSAETTVQQQPKASWDTADAFIETLK